MTSLPAIAAYGFSAAAFGTLGGLGGAVLLVPFLVIAGLDPATAAPIGLLTVIGGSLAAASRHIDAGFMHHRVGMLTETAASAGAMAGAAAAGAVSAGILRAVLIVVAMLGAVMVMLRRPRTEDLHPAFAAEAPGEWPGTLAGTAPAGAEVVPYAAKRVGTGVVLAAGAGIVAGISGVSGGYLKMPVFTEIMRIPPRVAAATSTFTVGITASAALLVFLGGGHVKTDLAAAAVAGALAGGRLGVAVQERIPERAVQALLSAALLAVAATMAVTA